MTRWIVRMAHDRKLLAPQQFEFSALQLNECGRMVGGWLRSRGGGHRSPRAEASDGPRPPLRAGPSPASTKGTP